MQLLYLKSALKCDSFDVTIGIKIQDFLEFWLLLSRVAPYYSSLPRTVWFNFDPMDKYIKSTRKELDSLKNNLLITPQF